MDGAVLLGDIVASRRVGADVLDDAMASLRRAAQDLERVAGPSHFTRFRGDGWQLVTLRPEMALRIAVALMAALVRDGKVRTRAAIGLGQIESLAGGDLGAASGSAFLRSGQALDDMSPKRLLALEGAPAPAAVWLGGLLPLAEFVIDRWSPPQAEAVSMALGPGWTVQGQLADRLGISRQAMHTRLKGAGYPAIAAAIAAFETHDWGTAT